LHTRQWLCTLFSSLALTVRLKFNLPENYLLHSDTTSHILHGDYRTEEGAPPPQLLINYGYSKDKRKDMKQIMTGMVTDGDEGVNTL
jgi:transposase